jgi:hypothetical protein
MYDDAECMYFEELTEEEMELQLESYRMMQKLILEGKTIYSFDQEWLM